MEILILLIPMGVVIALVIGAAFWWSADNGQFDDLESPGQRILMDDDRPAPAREESPQPPIKPT
ncbi:MAG: cbb3-type cytochrome oxidase assembly protein CcoS [Burkholderiales bacterium]|nr:cbb3-type cytochrome oxidase assembly protein CcoS [Burkholderiales bacterium]